MENKKKLSKSAKIAISAALGLSVATAVVVPTVVATNNANMNHITIDYNIQSIDSCKVTVKADTKVRDLPIQSIAGYSFKGWYKDEACTIAYELNEVVSRGTTVFAKLEVVTYAVVFPTSEFFKVSTPSTIVSYGQSLSFTIDQGEISGVATVTANGQTLTPVNGVYTIQNITSNVIVAIDGLLPEFVNLSVNIDGEKQTVRADFGLSLQEVIDTYQFGVTDENSCGWYLDENFTQVADMSTVLTQPANMSLYTKTVTQEMLNALTVTEIAEPDPSSESPASAEKLALVKVGETTLNEIVIPKVINGYTLTQSMFDINSTFAANVKSVILPTTINNITGSGNMNVDGYGVEAVPEIDVALTNINLHNKIEVIDNAAFGGYSNLRVDFSGLTSLTTIGEAAFALTNVVDVVLPKSVKTIGGYAFESCCTLKSFIIQDDSVTKIGEYAFENCEFLETVEFGNKLEIIDEAAFIDCYAIKEITIPDSLTQIVDWAFARCNRMKRVNVSSLAKWCGMDIGFAANPFYEGLNSAKLYINGQLLTNFAKDDKTVTEFKAHVFEGYDYFEGDLVIPDAVTKIGESAFEQCYTVKSVTIGDGVEEIDYGAFYFNRGISSVVLGKNVTTMDKYAFSDCEGIMEVINYSKNVIIGEGSYKYLDTADYITNVTDDTVVESKIKIIDNVRYLIDKEQGLQIAVGTSEYTVTDIVLHPDTTAINAYAFYQDHNLNLQTVVIGDKVEYIGKNAFEGCYRLRSVVLGKSVRSIGNYAFYNCYRLKEIINYSSLTIELNKSTYGYIGSYAKYITNVTDETIVESKIQFSNGAYYYIDRENGIKALIDCMDDTAKEVVLDNDMTEICSYAFCYYFDLQTITIPESLKIVGSSAFYYCESLTTVNIPSIEKWALMDFKDATATPMFESSNAKLYVDGVEVGGAITINGNSSSTKIGSGAFYNIKTITSVTIGDNITDVGLSAFNGCSALKEIHISSIEKWAQINFEENIFRYTPDAKLYINGVEFVGGDIVINGSETFTKIGDYAFSGMNNITTVTINGQIKEIGSYSFRECTNLQSVTFGDNIETIGESSFSNCSNLQTVIIGENMNTVCYNAFGSCLNLTNIYYTNSEEKFNQITIDPIGNNPFKKATKNYYYGWDVVSETPATCTQKGKIVYSRGDETGEIILRKLAHTFEDGVCTICGHQTGITINPTAGTYGYTLSEGVYTSNNKGVKATSAIAKITAQKDCVLTIDWTVSSEPNDKITITRSGSVSSTLVTAIGGDEKGSLIEISLAAGDIITITYTKNNYTNNLNDCATFVVIE